jgi:hypothetical protein
MSGRLRGKEPVTRETALFADETALVESPVPSDEPRLRAQQASLRIVESAPAAHPAGTPQSTKPTRG